MKTSRSPRALSLLKFTWIWISMSISMTVNAVVHFFWSEVILLVLGLWMLSFLHFFFLSCHDTHNSIVGPLCHPRLQFYHLLLKPKFKCVAFIYIMSSSFTSSASGQLSRRKSTSNSNAIGRKLNSQ